MRILNMHRASTKCIQNKNDNLNEILEPKLENPKYQYKSRERVLTNF
jgi:hypothetical protein